MTVESFGSFDEAMRVINERVAAAKQRITERQWKLADGKEHWFVKLWQMGPEVIVIVGHIPDLDEHRRDLIEQYGDDEETAYEVRAMREKFVDGFVFTRSYSYIEPDGEYGDQHISTLAEISKEVFERVVAAGFNNHILMADEEFMQALSTLVDR